MIPFLKYTTYGLLGLALRLVFPEIPVEWMIITLAYAYFSKGLSFTLGLCGVLSLFYSAFSSIPLWQWALPAVLGLLTFLPLRHSLTFQGYWGLAWLTGQLWLADFLFWNLYTLVGGFGGFRSFWAWMGLPATLGVGILLLPVFCILLQQISRRIPRPRRPMRELPRYSAQNKKDSSLATVRKPFGFEKGF